MKSKQIIKLPAAVLALVAVAPLAAMASGSGSVNITLTPSTPAARVDNGEIWDYRVRYNVSSTSENGSGVRIEMDFDPRIKVMNISGSSHTTGHELKNAAYVPDGSLQYIHDWLDHFGGLSSSAVRDKIEDVTARLDEAILEWGIDWSFVDAELDSALNDLQSAIDSSYLTTAVGDQIKADIVRLKSTHDDTGPSHSIEPKISFTFVDPVPAGSSGDLYVQARFRPTVIEGEIVEAQATISSSNFGQRPSGISTVLATNGYVPPDYDNRVVMDKSGPGSAHFKSEFSYYLTHGWTGAEGNNVSNYEVVDILPPNVKVVYFDTGRFKRTSKPVDIFYRTNSSSSWTPWPGNPRTIARENVRVYPSELGLSPGDYVTALRFSYGRLRGKGGKFHPEAAGAESIRIRATVADQALVTHGDQITNTATAKGDGHDEPDSVTTTLNSPSGTLEYEEDVTLNKQARWSSVYKQGSFDYYIHHGFLGSPGSSMTNYVIVDELPVGTRLDYVKTGDFEETYNERKFYFKTNLDSNWRQYPVIHETHQYKTIGSWHLGLVDGEHVTAFKLDWGTATGGDFHPDNDDSNDPTYVRLKLIDPDAWSDGNTVTNCANLSGTGYFADTTPGVVDFDQTDCADVNVWGGKIDYTVDAYIPSGTGTEYKQGETARLRLTLGSDSGNNTPLEKITMIGHIPGELTYAGNMTVHGDAYPSGSPEPEVSVISNYLGKGFTIVRVDFSNTGFKIEPQGWNYRLHVDFDVTVNYDVSNGSPRFYTYAAYQPEGAGWVYQIVDQDDLDGDDNTSDLLAWDSRKIYLNSGASSAAVETVLWVKGQLDSDWSKFPAIGNTIPGGTADYELRVKNTGEVGLADITIIDILPRVGDIGVIDHSNRGSEWSPFLVGRVEAPEGVKIYYSTSGNPKRTELGTPDPSGAEEAAWTEEPPANITEVKSIKFEFGQTFVAPGEEVVFGWPMRVPALAPYNGEVAWNSFGVISSRTDKEESLLATEPVKTGVQVQAGEGGILGDLVWSDEDGDGLQNPGEPGVNGVLVELYRASGPVPDPESDVVTSFTVTTFDGLTDGGYLFAGLPAGSYYPVVYPPVGYLPSPSDAGDDLVDSDGVEMAVGGRRAFVMQPVAITSSSGDDGDDDDDGGGESWKDDRSRDQGLVPMSGAPSVWAIEETGDGRVYLGGDFVSSHSVPRSRIARVMENGSLDLTFDPGTGFDGTVRAILVTGDGSILVGGSFTTYNGFSVNGLAHIDSDGQLISGSIASPDGGTVHSIAKTSDGRIVVVGDFETVQGFTCRGLALLTDTGELDTSFGGGSLISAGGAGYSVGVVPDGRLLIGGDFTIDPGDGGPLLKNLVCFKADGSIDPSFAPVNANGEVRSIKVYPWGDIVISGEFDLVNGAPSSGIALLGKDGVFLPQIENSELDVEVIRRSH